jgi:hypothetical protein
MPLILKKTPVFLEELSRIMENNIPQYVKG